MSLPNRFAALAPKALLSAAVLIVAGVVIAGCGGGDDETSADTTAPAIGSTPKKELTIKMGEFYFKPSSAVAAAGKVKITAPNEGSVTHELVLARTDLPASDLPTEANGEVNEAKFEESGDAPGEIADVLAGKTKSASFDLPAGRYVMYCNLPGHYQQGMYGTIVTE